MTVAKVLRTGVLVAGAAASMSGPAPGPEAATLVVLWAWQRPEDVSFADPAQVSVAYLWATARVSASGLEVTGRRQPLRVSSGTQRIPVVRVEVPVPMESAGLERNHDGLVDVVAAAANGAPAVQIDFDARRSERAFYARFLRGLRLRLPRGTRLSITALASWCLADRWIEGLPIDEAVPMLFRMGPEGARVRARLSQGEDFPVDVCRSSYGLAADEPTPRLRAGRTIYVFHPRAWSWGAYDRVRARLGEVGQP